MTEKEKLLDLIIAAKRNDPETGSFTEWLTDYLLANGVTVQKWIPVEERLPERFEKVLCWYEYRNKYGKVVRTHDIGFYFKDDAWGGEVSNGYDAKVLAWMPLPDAYREDGEA